MQGDYYPSGNIRKDRGSAIPTGAAGEGTSGLASDLLWESEQKNGHCPGSLWRNLLTKPAEQPVSRPCHISGGHVFIQLLGEHFAGHFLWADCPAGFWAHLR